MTRTTRLSGTPSSLKAHKAGPGHEVLEEVVIDVKKIANVKNTLKASGALASLVAIVATVGATSKWW